MNIYVNEKKVQVEENTTAYYAKNMVKKNADIIILNGFNIKEDVTLKENDKVTLIKKGEIPNRDEIESLLISRHTPGVHEKVKKASVGIAGLGGLGSNAAISLARIGVGKLVLVDFDVVEPSNLNRQQYLIKHIGMSKAEAMKDIIWEINPFIQVDIIKEYVTKDNAVNIFDKVDIIIEAFDNAESKAVLVNTMLEKSSNIKIIAASGMAGYFSSNTIKTKKISNRFYLVGDGVNEAKVGSGLMAPRVSIAANHQANAALRLIMGDESI